jgi:hypothetical protein
LCLSCGRKKKHYHRISNVTVLIGAYAMLTRRRCLLVFAVFATMAVLAVAVWLLWPRTAITRENAAKIRAGMTLADVKAILGGAPRDDVDAGTVQLDFDPDPIKNEKRVDELEEKTFGAHPMGPRPLVWRSGEVVLVAQFDDSRVTACAAFPVRPVEQSLLDRIRRWFR